MSEEHVASERLDLGSGVTLEYTSWAPDRDLNPQYGDLPDVPRVGAMLHYGGCECVGSILFDSAVVQRIFPEHPRWTVEAWEPLTISPSIRTTRVRGEHEHHGYIRAGRWVPA